MSKIAILLSRLIKEGTAPKRFYDISGVENVISNAKHVSLGSEDKFREVAKELSAELALPDPPELSSQFVNPPEQLTNDEKFNWYLLMDAINFHFYYPDGGRYKVSDGTNCYSGSMAGAAAINLWIKENPNILTPGTFSQVKKHDVSKYFRDVNGCEIPMIDERVDSINSTFSALKDYAGSFYSVVEQCEWDSAKLLCFILENFPSFLDVDVYKLDDGTEEEVAFCKRAQLLIADTFRNLGHLSGKVLNDDFLSAFADYRIPQVLRYFGLIIFDDYLDQEIRKGFIEDKQLEIEIRAATLAACHRLSLICGKSSADIDYALWKKRRIFGQSLDSDFPYHKSLTIFY
uniref:Queuosine 5'-phosphate N-glycosylase/hydrolase n=1 Tax=Panagrolaimus sp. JU765 TaxID=591449 RepID=A0AC34RCC3_9BILA